MRKFLRANKGLDFCERCLARQLQITARQARDAMAVLRAPEFERRTGLCAACLQSGGVIGCPIT